MRNRFVFSLFIGIFTASAIPSAVFSQYRSSSEIFPDYDAAARERLFSPPGILNTSQNANALRLLPPALSGFHIEDSFLNRDLTFLIESLMVIQDTQNPVALLNVYNALSMVRGLSGRSYYSFTRKRNIPLFEDATRLESAKKLSPIPDPPAARVLPAEETMFLRFKDANFGNSFYRADITSGQRGLIYRLSNFRNLTYLFVPVIREDKFIAQLYIEPLLDGILVYGIAGAVVSDFVASKVDIPSSIQKRLVVIIDWVIEGVKNGS
jgi:hypothetical protein